METITAGVRSVHPPRRTDPDDTSNCPLDSRCEWCRSRQDLWVATASSELGVFCLTLCGSCIDHSQSPTYPLGVATRRVLEHGGHLGCSIDDLDTGAGR